MFKKTKTNLQIHKFSKTFQLSLQILTIGVLTFSSLFTLTNPVKVMARTRTTLASKCVLGMDTMDWEKNCSLVKFDSRLGKLKTVKLMGSAATETTWLMENLNAKPQSTDLEVKNTEVILRGPTPATNLMIINLPLLTQTISLPAYDGLEDFNGLSGNSYNGITANIDDDNKIYPKVTENGSNSQDLTDATSLAIFTGTTAGQNIDIPIAASNRSLCGSSGNVSYKVETLGSAEISVVYEYEDYDVAIDIIGPGPNFVLPIIVPDRDYPLIIKIENKDSEPTPPNTKATLLLPIGITFDETTFSLTGWSVVKLINSDGTTLLTFTKTTAMAGNQIVDLPIIIKATAQAPNTIILNAKSIVDGIDFVPIDNQRTRDLEKDLPPILSTTTGSFVNTAIFAAPIGFLGATDPNTLDSVRNFVIKSLPNPASGILYLDNAGTIPVTLGQILTPTQARGLFFKPTTGFVGVASFNFNAKDSFDLENPVPLAAVLTITAPVNNNSTFFGGGVGSLVNNTGTNSGTSSTNTNNQTQNNSQNNQTNTSQNGQVNNSQNSNVQNQNLNQQNINQNNTNLVPKNSPINKIIIAFKNLSGENIEIKVEPNGDLKLSQNIDQNALLKVLQFGETADKLKENGIIAIEKNGQIQLIYNQNAQVLGINSDENGQGGLKNNSNPETNLKTNSANSSQIKNLENEKAVVILKEKTLEINVENNLLIRTGGENLANKIIAILIIISGIGLIWTFFGKNKIFKTSENLASNSKDLQIPKPNLAKNLAKNSETKTQR